MSAGYPPARPDNWPGGQYTNPNGVPQGSGSLSVNSAEEREVERKQQEWGLQEGGTEGRAIGCNDGKIKFAEGNPGTH